MLGSTTYCIDHINSSDRDLSLNQLYEQLSLFLGWKFAGSAEISISIRNVS